MSPTLRRLFAARQNQGVPARQDYVYPYVQPGRADPGLSPYALPNLVANYDTSNAASVTSTTANFSGTGTATSTLVDTTFVGVGTIFLSELATGDSVYNGSDQLIGVIASVTNDTNAVLQANGLVIDSGAAFRISKANPRVSQINNASSGVGTALVQATAGAQPTLGTSGLLFDGANDYLKATAFTINQPETVYFVGQQVTWTASDIFWDGNTGNSAQVNQSPSSTPNIRQFAGSQGTDNGLMTLGTNAIVCSIFNGATSILRINNKSPISSNSGTNNPGGFTLGSKGDGAANYGNIQVNEILIFAAAHDVPTQNSIIKYLATKWSIVLP